MELTQRVAELEMELTQQRLSLARQQDLEVTPQPPKAELSQPSPRWSPARRSTPPHRTQPPRVTPIAAAPTSLHQVDWAHEEDGYSTHSESQGEESEAVSSARLGQPAAAEAGGTSGGGLDAIRRKAQAALDGARQALQTLQGSTSRLPSTTSTSREPSRDVDAIGVVRSHSQDSSHLASAARPGFEDVAGTLDDDVGDPVEEIDSVFFYRIKAGIPVLKHGKWGRPHPRTLWLNTEERPPELVWQRGSGAPRAAAVDGGAISLGQVVRTTVGLTSKVLQRSGSVESSQWCVVWPVAVSSRRPSVPNLIVGVYVCVCVCACSLQLPCHPHPCTDVRPRVCIRRGACLVPTRNQQPHSSRNGASTLVCGGRRRRRRPASALRFPVKPYWG